MVRAPDTIEKICQRAGLSRAVTEQRLHMLVGLLGRHLTEGQRLTIPDLGTWGVSRYQARRVRHPQKVGETVMVAAHNVPTFTPGRLLKNSLKTIAIHRPAVPLRTVARPLAIEFVDLADQTIPKSLLALIPEQALRRYQIVPFALEGKDLHLAMVDPENHEAIELVKKATGKKVTPYLTTQTDLAKILDSLSSGTAEIAALAQEAESTIEALPEEAADGAEAAETAALEHAPAAKLVSQLIKRAVRETASDIHIEPSEEATQIRFRVDGVLRAVATVPRAIHAGLISRIKVLTNLRLDEHRLPQDGRFRAIVDHGEIDFRVSVLPTVAGEKVVMRLLDKSAGILTLDQLGVRGQQAALLIEEIKKPHGMIMVTGPTGSGKTTTLYAVIDRLRAPSVNISTLEDPVEYRLSGINQSQVNTDIGYTFAAGLRSLLRQDPNIILVGEIRDTETAEIAIHAALTGHIVLTTLHTNDAAGAIPRLIDMGIEPFLITSSLNAVVAQRLVRKICDKCRHPVTIDSEQLPEVMAELRTIKHDRAVMKQEKNLADKLSKPVFYAGAGCAACGKTGYKGRLGIYEILPVNDQIKSLITARTDAAQIAAADAKLHLLTLRQDGVLKALAGLTTIEEVWRVTKV